MKSSDSNMIVDRVLAAKRPPITDSDGILQDNLHAVTTIAGRRVSMEEFLVYLALKEGDHLTPDGKLAGVRTRRLPNGEIHVMLKDALRQRSMRQELLRLIEEQQNP